MRGVEEVGRTDEEKNLRSKGPGGEVGKSTKGGGGWATKDGGGWRIGAGITVGI